MATKTHAFHLTHSDTQVSNDEIISLNNLIKQSFELDSVGVSTLRRENPAHIRAVNILDQTSRYLGNRWEVGLPFVKDEFQMPASFEYARARLRGLLKKFQVNSEYADRYTKEINKLFSSGYARELNDNELSASHVWYLSHFGVQSANKPDKLRLVFDGAGKVNGLCLNDFLLTGPDLYNSLLGIMIRFREQKFVIIGDIKEMFLQIRIRPDDQNVFRFLWQSSPEKPLKICAMQSLIFGATCSPFIAQYIKNKNALKFQDLYPEACDVIVNNFYMDDCLHSCATETSAIKLVHDITEIHKQGGFEITRWSSNSVKVLESILNNALAQTALELKHGFTDNSERVLGLIWHPSDDTFGFQVSLHRIPNEVLNGHEPPSKAKMLSIIMSVYDLHGFLSPFLIKAKIIFQNVHRSGVEWNNRIQPNEHRQWVVWLDELKQLNSLRIPRWYGNATEWSACYLNRQCTSDAETIIASEMHVFCDASIKAYATVIYWRLTRSDGYVLIAFVASKSRVSPLRPISIPRLELQGALLGARLAATIQSEHKIFQSTKRYFWTDSSTVLQWIRSDPRVYKPFVAHRLGELDELTKTCEWRYLPSKQNVATREDAPALAISDVWFQGPPFLRRQESEWPKNRTFKPDEDVQCEERTIHLTVIENTSALSLPSEDRVSRWITLLRASARVLLFIRKCQRKVVHLDIFLMKEAEILLVKKSQADAFYNELSCIRANKPLSPTSRLLQLSPYLDETGVLRVGGRIDKVIGVDFETRRPIILDGKHRITRLLVEHFRRQAFHGANELVVNQLRQQYWVINLRPTVRSIGAQCLFCRYRRADLPSVRLEHNRPPFSFCGVDYFGPLEVTIGRKKYKRYGMIFTCLTIRAIHIELTEDLSTDSTIMAT